MASNERSPCFTSALFPVEDSTLWSGIHGLRSACLGMTLLDIEAPFPMKGDCLTPREAARALGMGPRRQKGFTAARVALKKLSRQLGLVDKFMPDRTIETLGPDNVRPCLAESGLFCSVSHNVRFVVAVAHRYPIGVDLEAVSNKLLRTRNLFMLPREQDLISLSCLAPERTVTRAWTTKEAAAKALGLHLFEAIREVEVIGAGEEEGMMRYREKTRPVKHSERDGHVLTLITCDGP